MDQQTVTPTAVTPPPMTVQQHIEAEAPPPAPMPGAAPAVPAVPAVAAPAVDAPTVEAEADSTKPDAELSEAARALRGNRKDERIKRVKAENDELARELHRRKEIRSELDQLATGRPAAAGADQQPAGNTPHIDPRDPEPTLEAFSAAHPNHLDPYAGWQRELARWDRRQEQRQADAERRAADGRQQADQTARQLQERAVDARTKYSDYDAVIVAFDQTLGDHPANDAISRFVARSKVGGDLAYRLAKESAATIEAIKGGRDVLLAHLGAVEASLTATAKSAAATTITTAPPPPSQTAGGASPATELDTRKGVPTADHIRIEEAELAERRRRGLRN